MACAPKFLEDSQNKFLANEEENAFVQLEVFGDPAPTAQWFRVRKISQGGEHKGLKSCNFREKLTFLNLEDLSSGLMVLAVSCLWVSRAVPRLTKVFIGVSSPTGLGRGNTSLSCSFQVSKFIYYIILVKIYKKVKQKENFRCKICFLLRVMQSYTHIWMMK